MRSFLENERVERIAAGSADGQGTVTSDIVDTAGHDSFTFLALVGAVTGSGVVTMTISQDTDSAFGGDPKALEGAVATLTGSANGDSVLAVEVYRPTDRYLRAVVTRGTANSVFDGLLCIKRDAQSLPVSQDATVIDSAFVASPTES